MRKVLGAVVDPHCQQARRLELLVMIDLPYVQEQVDGVSTAAQLDISDAAHQTAMSAMSQLFVTVSDYTRLRRCA